MSFPGDGECVRVISFSLGLVTSDLPWSVTSKLGFPLGTALHLLLLGLTEDTVRVWSWSRSSLSKKNKPHS